MGRRAKGWIHSPRKPFGANPDRSAAAYIGGLDAPESATCVHLMPDALDQRGHESCTGYSAAAIFYAAERLAATFYATERLADIAAPELPSPLWGWYGGRLSDGTQREDAGTYPRAVLDWYRRRGYPSAALWPDDDALIEASHGFIPRWQAMPDASVFAAAHDLRDRYSDETLLIDSRGDAFLDDCRRALAAGHPFQAGFFVNGAYETATGAETVSLAGGDAGHSVVVVAYEPGRWLTQSSWGPEPGVDGRIWIDEASMRGAMDAWLVVRSPVLKKEQAT